MLDALTSVLLDWLGDVDDCEFQATLLARPLGGRVNRLVAKHKNRAWHRFDLSEHEVSQLVAQILSDAYFLSEAGEAFAIEYCGGQRRDLLRGEVIRETTR
jgi:hypothetical protein